MEQNKVYIMIGLPGSGKSTYIKTNLNNPVVCSADHFFMTDGKYVFDPKKLGEAHQSCLRNFINSCISRVRTVVVDNTNTTIDQVSPYYSIAKAYGYKVILVKFNVTKEISFERNVHGVSMKAIEGMEFNLSRLKFPPFWDFEIISI